MRRILFSIVLGAALAGCGSQREVSSTTTPASRQMRVEWLGHECFQFTSSFGLRVITNPFDSSVGTMPKGLSPEVLLVTTEQPAFNNDDAMENTPVIFRGAVGTGMNNASGMRIRGVPTYRDAAKSGEMNLVFCWTMDGMHICFLGNIQGPLSGSQLSEIGTVDVLFLPVGLPASLSDAERSQLIEQLHPRVIVPMGPRSAVTSWGATQPHPYPVGGSTMMLSHGTLPFEQTVMLFSPQ